MNLSLIPELHPLDIAKIETDRRFNSATEIVPDELQPFDEQYG